MQRLSLFAAVLTFAAGCPGPSPAPSSPPADGGACTRADCADARCSAEPVCKTSTDPDAGTQGPPCMAQAQCLKTSYIFDDPLPACVQGHCVANPKGIDVRFELDISALFGATKLGALNTRFVLKRAADGTAVSCEALQAAGAGKTPDRAAQLEDSRRFNLLAYDVTRVDAPAGANIIVQPFLNTGVGGDFIIWTEVWTGVPNSDTKLPTGLRLGYGCIESGPATEELKPEHDWPNGSSIPTSRTLRAKITHLD